MMNYLVIDDVHIQIEHGIFGDVDSFHTYPSGELESVKLGDRNMVVTHAGELVPAYSETPRRKNKPSVEFHKSGMIKAVSLEEQSEVVTPIGELPAERVTFYPTGELNRLFIVDGQISGFWSEEEEKELNIPLTFAFEFGEFTAYLNSISFYKDGSIKSITLYPGEKIDIQTPAGPLATSIGFSLYESGKLKSIEPAESVLIHTPIGDLTAYNPDAVGVHADANSVTFDEKGRLTGLTTVENRILVETAQGEFLILKPQEAVHPLHDEEKVLLPMSVNFDFDQDEVTIMTDSERTFSMADTHFTVNQIDTGALGCTPADCASCSLCSSKNTTS